MTKNTNIAAIDFYGQPISTIKKDNVEYVAMRQIVEGIGINWASQSVKLRNNEDKFGCCDIATPSKGGLQKSLCVPLKKLTTCFP